MERIKSLVICAVLGLIVAKYLGYADGISDMDKRVGIVLICCAVGSMVVSLIIFLLTPKKREVTVSKCGCSKLDPLFRSAYKKGLIQ